jgi:DNA polymerase
MIVPPDGMEMVIVDLAAVEARGLAWIAGQHDLCEAFRQGRDTYIEFASKIAKRPLRKSKKTDPAPVKKMLDRMRSMGKIAILGGGYGMGAEKCQAYASTSYGVEITLPEAIELIQTYRASVPQITRFWRECEQKFKAAARYGEPGEMARGLKFHKEADRDIVVITLPSGRELKYHGVRVSIVDGKDSIWMPDKFKKGTKIKMWGGYLTENIVQALCRDFLAESILASEKAGWHVALTAHDEIVALAPVGQGEKAKAEIIGIMSTAPDWAPGCPLGAEGKVCDHYEK